MSLKRAYPLLNKLGQSNQQVVLWSVAFACFAILFFPTYERLYSTVWQSDEQGHGLLVFLIVVFLLWQKRSHLLDNVATNSEENIGLGVLIVGLLVYTVGRSQDVQFFDVGSQVIILSGLMIYLSGYIGLKRNWFPVFFILFMIPLPGTVVDALTMPMKIAVSNVSEWILYHLEYPISREGVMLQIGYYKLLVADACAGLHTVFSLEAMGLLYLHLINRDSFARNITLAVLILPISFIANSIRVIALVLITYYYGDEVGQGFVHEFAGFVLFGSALFLIILVDTAIHKVENFIQKRRMVSAS